MDAEPGAEDGVMEGAMNDPKLAAALLAVHDELVRQGIRPGIRPEQWACILKAALAAAGGGSREGTTGGGDRAPREVIARRRAGYMADEMVHAPWQKSWEKPAMRAWESHALDVDDDLAALEAAGFVIVRAPGALAGIEVDPERCAGRPVLAGTRITVARLLAEIADGRTPNEVADDFGLDRRAVRSALGSLSAWLDGPGGLSTPRV